MINNAFKKQLWLKIELVLPLLIKTYIFSIYLISILQFIGEGV